MDSCWFHLPFTPLLLSEGAEPSLEDSWTGLVGLDCCSPLEELLLFGFLSHQVLGIVSENCEVLTKTPLPSCTLDLSPLKHVWFELGVQLSLTEC